jgi:hypothetical protein
MVEIGRERDVEGFPHWRRDHGQVRMAAERASWQVAWLA